MANFKKGIYYLGRVTKMGVLNNHKLISALKHPTPIHRWNHSWTFIDVREFKNSKGDFVYGRLCKYSPDAEVLIVDTDKRAEVTQLEPNLSVASSPFIFIPEHSAIAFLRVSNHIEPHLFMKRFKEIIEKTHQNFFVECTIEPISDLQTFAIKLSKLEGIFKITSKVYPPNPLFGPLWAPLKKYIQERGSDKMKIEEESLDQPLNTELPKHVKLAAEQSHDAPFIPDQNLPIGDAAILMAADGYGSGLVKGKQQGQFVIIRTSETTKNFTYDKIPDPEGLFELVLEVLEKIQNDRHMNHE
jgi:hypothetical protein